VDKAVRPVQTAVQNHSVTQMARAQIPEVVAAVAVKLALKRAETLLQVCPVTAAVEKTASPLVAAQIQVQVKSQQTQTRTQKEAAPLSVNRYPHQTAMKRAMDRLVAVKPAKLQQQEKTLKSLKEVTQKIPVQTPEAAALVAARLALRSMEPLLILQVLVNRHLHPHPVMEKIMQLQTRLIISVEKV
jgi:hypothetical protein